MDIATPIGIVFSFVLIIVVMIMEGGTPASLIIPAPMLLVFGVTILVSIAGGTMADAKAIPKNLVRAFQGKSQSAADLVPVVVQLAERARREGLLALEDAMTDVKDPFLQKGVTMAIDGTDPEELREILEAELAARRKANKHAAQFFTSAGGYAPTIGIIGTCMSLVHVLSNLSDPESLGPLIASAFIATLWGITSANVIWFPIAKRLHRLGDLEVDRMELIVEGVAAIQSGSNPRLVAEKLKSFLPHAESDSEEAA